MYKHANVYFSNYSNFILVVTPQLASDLCVHIIPKTISNQFIYIYIHLNIYIT